MKRTLSILALAGLMLGAAPRANASTLLGTYAFSCITNNTGYCSSVAPQMSMELWAENAGSTQVLFKIFNDKDLGSPDAHISTITEVYFDAGNPATLGSFAGFTTSGPGVSFAVAPVPAHAPGYLGTWFTVYFDGQENAKGITKGVDQGEWLGVLFDLAAGVHAGDLLGLVGGVGSDVKVGLHVQSIDNGTSEGMVTTRTSVPEPASLLLLGTGLLCAGWLRRKR